MLALKISQQCFRSGFMRLLHQSGSVVMSKEIQKVHQPIDDLGQSIKSATDTLELFDALAQHDKVMGSDLVMQSLKTLFTLQKSGYSSLQTSQIIHHPQFEKLCRDLRAASRSLELNDIIQALKVLAYIGIPANSNIMYIILNMLRRQVNDLSLSHIIFLSFLLKKLEKTPLVEALEIALPMIFQLQLSAQIDHENVPELVELLMFAANNKVADKCIMSIVSALTLHGESVETEKAVNIVWALTELENYKPTYDRLLTNCFNVLIPNLINLHFDRIDMLIHRAINKYMLKNEAFYSEGLLNAAARYVVHNDVGFMKAIFIMKKFNKINFVNISLLDYAAQKLLDNPDSIRTAKPSVYFPFLSAYSIANYTPQNWDMIKPHLLANAILDSPRNDLPWMKLNLELLSIGCYSKHLIEKVFDDEFLHQHLAREQHLLDYLQMLSLYQCTQTLYKQYDGIVPAQRFIQKAIELALDKPQFPLKSCLEMNFGGTEYVGTRILTRLGHFIDHIVVFDQDQRPVVVNEATTSSSQTKALTMEDLKLDNGKVVAILACRKSYYILNQQRLRGVFDLRIRTLEAMGIPVVQINLHQWLKLPDRERTPYLDREVKLASQR